jgi:pyruvate/2-oxoglutarate dehydrogenase complex dihydrolipoamide dehydrogenase (E3) component
MVKIDSALDEYRAKFQRDIFPSNWKNPQPADLYDMLIIGAGPGGMTAASIARSFDAKVALVENVHFGGECLNVGCIPSKALIRSSRVAAEVRNAHEYGIEIPKGWKVDFKSIMQRVYRCQATLSPHDAVEHFKKLGADVFLGPGRFIGPNKIEVRNQVIHFKKAFIVTGTNPIPLNIPGLEKSGYLTNQNVFELSYLPPRLAFIGGGPISCELSQAFLRFGSEVTLVTGGPTLLPRDETIAAERLQKVFEKEGMRIVTQSQVRRVENRGKQKILHLDPKSELIIVDDIFVAIGRMPSVEGLNLEKAGIKFDLHRGIMTNDYQQTSNPDVYAVGDVASPNKFTHISMELAKMAVMNALNGHKQKSSSLTIPWCTFTDPEIAHIGLSEKEANERDISNTSIVIEMADMDRAVLDGETVGFAKLTVKSDSDQILGATLMASHAGDMIPEVGVAMAGEKGLIALSRAIHPFPTQGQILRTAASTLLAKRAQLLKNG